MFVSLLYADAGAAGQGAGGGFMGMVPILFFVAIFYFLIMRPQQKKAKDHQMMLDKIQKGDQVLTTGGIYGTVMAVKGAVLDVKIADEVKIRLSKSAVAAVVAPEQAVEAEIVEAVK